MISRKEIREKVLATRKLGGLRLATYLIINRHGPLSGSQVKVIYFGDKGDTNTKSETIRNRITELKKMGMVKAINHEIDPLTGVKISLFDITERTNPLPHLTSYEKLKAENLSLREKLAEFTDEEVRYP